MLDMDPSVKIMAAEIASRLGGGLHSLWLYGSVTMGDFRLGWSDIDFIAFSNGEITEEAAQNLLMLRQELKEREPENPYYRLFEGVIVNIGEYRCGEYKRLVYWGTSGQRITDNCEIDPFARYELAKYGKCVFGSADRSLFTLPDYAELASAVRRHYEGIREYAHVTDERLYSCGWLLDISRCIYTLKTGDVIAKTQAGEWALENCVFDDAAPLEKTLGIRKNPLAYKDDERVKAWLASLGGTVQSYADALERELENRSERERKIIKNKPAVIETERLILRPLEERDRESFIRMAKDARVNSTYMIPELETEALAHAFFEHMREFTENASRFVYGIALKNGEIIGFINDCELDGTRAELGYFIGTEHWNRGYASEALFSAIAALFEMGYTYLKAGHFEENAASRRVMEKCGMKRIDHEEELEYKGRMHHCLFMAIEKQ
ncbi:MAG: GNAT family N-acetyltransferase [Clostridia bacterium]|nr:GNAT family N-acetyltransferase [Clostridia bacterium]